MGRFLLIVLRSALSAALNLLGELLYMPMLRFMTPLIYCMAVLFSILYSFPTPAADTTSDLFQRHEITTQSAARPSFLPPEQAFQVSHDQDANGAYIQLQAAPGYYLYRDRIRLFQNDQDITSAVHFSDAQQKDDPAFGQVAVYHDSARLSLPQHVGKDPIDIHYQGCAEAGLCYPPLHKTLDITALQPASHATVTSPALATSGSFSPSLWTFCALYIAGIGLTFTPCVLPMLPIACAVVVGRNASRRRAFSLSLAYVMGMVIAHAALGIAVGTFGSSLQLQNQLQRPWVLIPMVIACALAAGWLFELYQLRLPLRLSMRLQKTHDRLSQQGLLGTLATGTLSTLVLSPCLSAPLAGVLIYLSTTGNMVMAILGLSALALGMGTPIILCCTFGAGLLPRAGAWMTQVRNIFGLLLLATALWLLGRILPATAMLLLWGIWGLGLARLMGVAMPLHTGGKAALQVASWAVALWSIACIVGAAAGGDTPLRPLAAFTPVATKTASSQDNHTMANWAQFDNVASLQQAIADEKKHPVVVDIYADWCVSCQHMEQSVYTAPELRPILSLFKGFRLNITHADATTLEFLQHHGLFGPPGMLFFVKGQEAADQRLVGEHSREEVEKHLNAVLNETSKSDITFSHD